MSPAPHGSALSHCSFRAAAVSTFPEIENGTTVVLKDTTDLHTTQQKLAEHAEHFMDQNVAAIFIPHRAAQSHPVFVVSIFLSFELDFETITLR